MSFSTTQRKQQVLATAAGQPSLLQQIGMAGCAAVITVTFIHPIDVVKVSSVIFLSGAALIKYCMTSQVQTIENLSSLKSLILVRIKHKTFQKL